MRIQAAIAVFAFTISPVVAQDHVHVHPSGPVAVPDAPSQPIAIPDVELVNQRGERVHFYADLVKGRTVAIQTIFTTCTTICPPMGATWGRLQTLLKDTSPARFNLISISIDPQVDTPEKLLKWGAQFHAGPEWTLLTGAKPEVDRLLRALRLYSPDKQSHTPLAIVGSDDGWQYVDVLKSQAPAIADSMRKSINSTVAHNYFTDVMLVDQNGKQVRFYSDVMKGRVVVINQFFTSCKDSCPVMAERFAQLQKWLGPRLGKEAFLVSISVDPVNDTPEKLREYAQRSKAGPGWIFLTGSKQNVDFALGKLGTRIAEPGDHTNMLFMLNMKTQLRKKVDGMASADAIAGLLQTVLDDRL